MEDQDAGRFAACITALAIATKGELDEPTIELYFRALADVPIHLLEAGSVELARTARFFPRPAEWRAAVDTILDRSQRKDLPGQPALPGVIGEAWRCPDCDNTGWVYLNQPCEKRTCWEAQNSDGPHSHVATTRCTNPDCLSRRQELAARRRRYSTTEED